MTDGQRKRLISMGFDLRPFSTDSADLDRIEYLLLHSKLDRTNLKKMFRCRYIGIRAHNTDYIDRKQAKEQGIFFRGLGNQHAVNAVAEHVFALTFSLAKNLMGSHSNAARGNWRDGLTPNRELKGATLGVLGAGRIGKRVQEIGKALGMNTILSSHDRSNLDRLFEESDIVSLHIPSGPENEKFVGKRFLNLMKDDSILINTARGSILDYGYLKEKLEEGKFRGIGLDVFPDEPVIDKALLEYENVLVTPHTAYNTGESLERMNGELIDNLEDYIRSREMV